MDGHAARAELLGSTLPTETLSTETLSTETLPMRTASTGFPRPPKATVAKQG